MIPHVSIITPTHNSAPYLKQTIDSVLAQTEMRWELLIVDDYSHDSTLEIANEFSQHDPRIKTVPLSKKSGPAIARNTGIEMTQGRYIAFLDSDDLWHPNKLEKQLAFMNTLSAGFTYTSYWKMNEDGFKHPNPVPIPPQVNYKQLLRTCVIGCLTAMYDTSKIGKVYMPNITKGQDYGLWLKILKTGQVAYGLNEPLAYYRLRKHSVSRNKFRAAKHQWRIYRMVEQLPIHQSAYYFLSYSYHGLRKTLFQ